MGLHPPLEDGLVTRQGIGPRITDGLLYKVVADQVIDRTTIAAD